MAHFLTTLLQSNSNPQIPDQTPRKNSQFFLQIWRTLSWRIGTKSRKAKWKIHYFSSPNLCLFQSQITFRYIYITSVICFCPSQNTNTQCIQECIFIKIQVIKHNLFHIKQQPNGEIVQNGAGQLPKQWHSNEKSLEMSSSFQYYTNDALDHSGPKKQQYNRMNTSFCYINAPKTPLDHGGHKIKIP